MFPTGDELAETTSVMRMLGVLAARIPIAEIAKSYKRGRQIKSALQHNSRAGALGPDCVSRQGDDVALLLGINTSSAGQTAFGHRNSKVYSVGRVKEVSGELLGACPDPFAPFDASCRACSMPLGNPLRSR